MTKTKPKILLCLILLCCLVSIWLLVSGFHRMQAAYNELSFLANNEYVWVFHLIFNCMGYAIIFVPGYILYKFVKKTDVLNRLEGTNLGKALYVCFGEYQRLPETMPKVKVDDDAEETPGNECTSLAICFCGLMGSYLTWGLLQEKIMTQTYTSADGVQSHFRDSQFLVFANRVSALVLSAAWLATRRKSTSVGPLYPFSYCSLSNVVSAWCQYEALKYISFPTQVLSKACKIIPVMVMGRVVSGNKYEPYEYATAVLLSAGMGLFMLGASDDYVVGDSAASRVTTFSGMLLLGGYLAADSFTSSWQAALFRARPALTPAHMMCLVNLFSCALTAVSLTQQGSFQHSFQFMAQAVAGPHGEFLDIISRYAGSTHDSRIFQMSPLFVRLRDESLVGILLGDNGYPCLPFLFTPILQPQRRCEQNYNRAHIKARNTVERMFGIWKKRFPCLSRGMGNKLITTVNIIVSCAVLHNMAISCNDQLPEEPEEVLDEVVDVPPPMETQSGFVRRQALIESYF